MIENYKDAKETIEDNLEVVQKEILDPSYALKTDTQSATPLKEDSKKSSDNDV